MNDEPRPVGLTRDAGWQIGVQRSVPVPCEAAWEYLLAGPGLVRWLGVDRLDPAPGTRYRTPDGTTGEIRSHHPGRKIRLTWRPAGWDHDTTLQLAVTPTAHGAAIRFHQERLAGPDERRVMRDRWTAVAEAIRADLSPGDR